MTSKILVLIPLVLIGLSIQWNLMAHSMIARMAEIELSNAADKPILEKVYAKINQMSKFFDTVEVTGSLLEVAVIPDILNFEWKGFLDHYHYKDLPELYRNDDPSFVLPRTNEVNAENALKAAKQIIKESFVPDPKKFLKPGFLDSLYTRYLIHVVGDVHQPLHTMSLYSKIYLNGKIINGDLGGNLIRIQVPGEKNMKPLHAYWDDGFGLWTRMDKFPYDEATKKSIYQKAEDLMKEYPKSYYGDRVNILDEKIWIEESHDLAVKIAYADIDIFPTVRPEYILRGRKISKERVALAGYRLANLLRDLFK